MIKLHNIKINWLVIILESYGFPWQSQLVKLCANIRIVLTEYKIRYILHYDSKVISFRPSTTQHRDWNPHHKMRKPNTLPNRRWGSMFLKKILHTWGLGKPLVDARRESECVQQFLRTSKVRYVLRKQGTPSSILLRISHKKPKVFIS